VVGAPSNRQHDPAWIAGVLLRAGDASQEAQSSAGAERSMWQTEPPVAIGAACTATKARRSDALVRRRTTNRSLMCIPLQTPDRISLLPCVLELKHLDFRP